MITNMTSPYTLSDGNSTLVERQVEAVVLSVISAVALVGNLSLWLVVLRTRSLWTANTALVLGLSAADILVSGINMPVTVYSLVQGGWSLSADSCVVFGFITMLTFIASVMSLGAISLHRYVLVCHPSKMQRFYTKGRTAAIILTTWALSATLALPPLVGWGRYAYLPGQSFCFCDWPSSNSYTFFMVATCFCGPLGVMTFCYINILREVRASSARMKAARTPIKSPTKPSTESQDSVDDKKPMETSLGDTGGHRDGKDGGGENGGDGRDGGGDSGGVESPLRGRKDGRKGSGTTWPRRTPSRGPSLELTRALGLQCCSVGCTVGCGGLGCLGGNNNKSIATVQPRRYLKVSCLTHEESEDDVIDGNHGNPSPRRHSITKEVPSPVPPAPVLSPPQHFPAPHPRKKLSFDDDVSTRTPVALTTEPNAIPLAPNNIINNNPSHGAYRPRSSSTSSPLRSPTRPSPGKNTSRKSTPGKSTPAKTAHEKQLSARKARKRREELRLTLSFLIIICIFIICWLPFCVTMFMSVFMATPVPRIPDMVTLLLGCFNSCCNPIIYGLLNTKFQQGYRRLFTCSRLAGTPGPSSGSDHTSH